MEMDPVDLDMEMDPDPVDLVYLDMDLDMEMDLDMDPVDMDPVDMDLDLDLKMGLEMDLVDLDMEMEMDMGKKLPYTPNSRINSALRQLFLRSRERAKRLKLDTYTCQRCGVKQSEAKGKEVKVEVHHKEGVLNWQEIYSVIREYLLCDADKLETLCKGCHKDETKSRV